MSSRRGVGLVANQRLAAIQVTAPDVMILLVGLCVGGNNTIRRQSAIMEKKNLSGGPAVSGGRGPGVLRDREVRGGLFGHPRADAALRLSERCVARKLPHISTHLPHTQTKTILTSMISLSTNIEIAENKVGHTNSLKKTPAPEHCLKPLLTGKKFSFHRNPLSDPSVPPRPLHIAPYLRPALSVCRRVEMAAAVLVVRRYPALVA